MSLNVWILGDFPSQQHRCKSPLSVCPVMSSPTLLVLVIHFLVGEFECCSILRDFPPQQLRRKSPPSVCPVQLCCCMATAYSRPMQSVAILYNNDKEIKKLKKKYINTICNKVFYIVLQSLDCYRGLLWTSTERDILYFWNIIFSEN